MSKLKKVLRSKLTETLQALTFKPGQFFITSFRATKDNSIQVEVCQNRRLGGRKRTLIGMVNRSDKRFSNDTTLLFDWMVLKPVNLLETFPELAKTWTVEDLKAIAQTYDPDGDKGTDAIVFQAVSKVNYIMDVQTEEKVHPIITVTEVTHSSLLNYEFYKGDNADDKIENELENGTAVMKTGSGEDADFIVDAESGDKIYRFTLTRVMEDYPKGNYDSMIAGKMTQKQYNRIAPSAKKEYANEEDVNVPAMTGGEEL